MQFWLSVCTVLVSSLVNLSRTHSFPIVEPSQSSILCCRQNSQTFHAANARTANRNRTLLGVPASHKLLQLQERWRGRTLNGSCVLEFLRVGWGCAKVRIQLCLSRAKDMLMQFTMWRITIRVKHACQTVAWFALETRWKLLFICSTFLKSLCLNASSIRALQCL